MPPDNAIALGVQTPQPAQNSLGIGSIAAFAQIQNSLNQNRLFQQTFAARQRAGQIISASPDIDTALQRIQQDPQVGAFAGQIGNEYKQYQLTNAQLGKSFQEQGDSAMQMFLKSAPGLYNNPGMWDGLTKAVLSVTNPQVRDRVQAGMENYRTAITAGIDPKAPPEVQRAQYDKNMTGILIGSGLSADAYAALAGKPETLDVKSGLIPGVRQPVTQGGGFAPAGGLIPFGTAPRVDMVPLGPSGTPTPTQLGGVGGAGVIGSANVAPNGSPAANALAGPTQAPGSVLGPSQFQADYNKQLAGDTAGYQKDLTQLITGGRGIMQTVDEARQALQQFHPGAGASTYARLGQIAQALGANPEMVDKIANGNLGASQEFQKLMVNTTMSQIHQQLQGIGGSRLSQMEFAAFNKNNPNIDTDPRAIDKIFDFWTKLHQINTQEPGALAQYLKSGGNVYEWPAEWQKQLQASGQLNIASQFGKVSGSNVAPPTAGKRNSYEDAVAKLRAQPELRDDFDRKYEGALGPNASDKILGPRQK